MLGGGLDAWKGKGDGYLQGLGWILKRNVNVSFTGDRRGSRLRQGGGNPGEKYFTGQRETLDVLQVVFRGVRVAG